MIAGLELKPKATVEVFRVTPDGQRVQFRDVNVTLQEACDCFANLLAYLRDHPELWPDVAKARPLNVRLQKERTHG